MSFAQTAWVLVLLTLPLVALLLFSRKRRSTVEYADMRVAKAALPWWVKKFETLLVIAFSYLWATAIFEIFKLLGGVRAPLVGASAVYVVLGIGFMVLPIAMLCANAASWVIPFLRSANQQSFRGTHVSFGSANAGLIKFAAVSVPFGAVALAVAALAPWNR